MTKRLFYPLFKAAYEEAFTQKNIKNAFAKAGIWPIDAKRVISKLQTESVTDWAVSQRAVN
jgi:hypothetical protein